MSFYSQAVFANDYHHADLNNFESEIDRLYSCLKEVDTVLIGAGAGLSSAAGLTYSGKRFEETFSDFKEKFNISDMYSGGFYPFPDLETYWAWWSRHIWINRYAVGATNLYSDLFDLVKNKNYFVLTTNVDHQFQLAGFDKNKLFYTQGDYGLFQCSKSCTQETYNNKSDVQSMIERQTNTKIPTDLIPYCPHCGAPMTTYLRVDNSFVEDQGWRTAHQRYQRFLKENQNGRVLLLELGVGNNTPVIIKYPFWSMTFNNPQATYACINLEDSFAPTALRKQSILLSADIRKVLEKLY